MQSSNVEINTGDIDRPYKKVATIEAKRSAATAFSPAPTYDEVNAELRQKAVGLGANAVIDVQYSRGMSFTSYKVLKASGTAVLIETDEVPCPFCAEMIKRAAIKCKHCGSEIPQNA